MTSPVILALETSTNACSAALWYKEQSFYRYQLAPRKHTELILPMLDAVLAEAGCAMTEVEALAFGRGPGAFTGVRIAAGLIQGMALVDNTPILAISSLACIAQGVYRRTGAKHILVVNDARMDEVYWARYHIQKGLATLAGKEQLHAPQALSIMSDEQRWYVAGSGWESYPERLLSALGDTLQLQDTDATALPDARDLLPLALQAWERGESKVAEQAIPVYLRDKVAQKPVQKKMTS